jgi:hypothetical protein
MATRGKNFQNLRPNNANNHEISLLQMKGCPQSNIKKEITIFCFKETLKPIENHLKKKPNPNYVSLLA